MFTIEMTATINGKMVTMPTASYPTLEEAQEAMAEMDRLFTETDLVIVDENNVLHDLELNLERN